MPRTIMRQCKCALIDSVRYNLRVGVLPENEQAGLNWRRGEIGFTRLTDNHLLVRTKQYTSRRSRWES